VIISNVPSKQNFQRKQLISTRLDDLSFFSVPESRINQSQYNLIIYSTPTIS